MSLGGASTVGRTLEYTTILRAHEFGSIGISFVQNTGNAPGNSARGKSLFSFNVLSMLEVSDGTPRRRQVSFWGEDGVLTSGVAAKSSEQAPNERGYRKALIVT
jgi:hypothetical protein